MFCASCERKKITQKGVIEAHLARLWPAASASGLVFKLSLEHRILPVGRLHHEFEKFPPKLWLGGTMVGCSVVLLST